MWKPLGGLCVWACIGLAGHGAYKALSFSAPANVSVAQAIDTRAGPRVTGQAKAEALCRDQWATSEMVVALITEPQQRRAVNQQLTLDTTQAHKDGTFTFRFTFERVALTTFQAMAICIADDEQVKRYGDGRAETLKDERMWQVLVVEPDRGTAAEQAWQYLASMTINRAVDIILTARGAMPFARYTQTACPARFDADAEKARPRDVASIQRLQRLAAACEAYLGLGGKDAEAVFTARDTISAIRTAVQTEGEQSMWDNPAARYRELFSNL